MTAAPDDPSYFKLQHSSPLDSLVRRTSARNARNVTTVLTNSPRYPSQDPQDTYPDSQNGHKGPPRPFYRADVTPASPLLHGHFSRGSTATSSLNDNHSYLDFRSSVDSRNTTYQDLEYAYYDNAHAPVDPPIMPALRDSWQSVASGGTLRPGNITNLGEFPITPRGFENQQPPSPLSPTSPIPTVVVSSPDPPPLSTAGNARSAGRVPIVRPMTSNYSRPVRMTAPSVPPSEEEERKRRVLERNARRSPSPQATGPQQFSRPTYTNQPSANHPQSSYPQPLVPPSIPAQRAQSPANNIPTGQSRNPNLYPRSTPSPTGSPMFLPSPRSATPTTGSTGSFPSIRTAPESVALPRRPPSLRPESPASLYSTYSYYQYDSTSPSPTMNEFRTNSSRSSSNKQNKPPSPALPPSPLSESNAQTPQEFLQLGIQHHEANRLKESAMYFERSAKENGGCGVGMLMFGLALRHGWGCAKNEKNGFMWLRRAAESAVEDLESARGVGGVDITAVQVRLPSLDQLFLGWCLTLTTDGTGSCDIRSWSVLLSGMGCRQRSENGCGTFCNRLQCVND